MRSEKKLAYQAGKIEKLSEEIKELQMELTAYRQEMKYKDSLLMQSEKEFEELKRRFEEYLFGYSERVERLTEAQMEYEQATAEVRALMKRYKKEAEENLRMIREAV